MSDIIDLQSDMAALASGKASLRGVTILSMDDIEYYKDLGAALANIHGVAVAIGKPRGIPDGINIPGGQFTVTIQCFVFENPAINRDRALAATVADQAARLALTGVVAGALVHQTDTDADWWLMTFGGEATAANWAPLLTATAILQLIIRTFQLSQPGTNQTLVCRGFEDGTIDEIHDYVARFDVEIGLDPAAVT
jgi:hypothetical protein